MRSRSRSRVAGSRDRLAKEWRALTSSQAAPWSRAILTALVQGRGCGLGIPAPVGQLAVDPPKLGFEVPLVEAAGPRESLPRRGSGRVQLADLPAGPREEEEGVGEVEGLAFGAARGDRFDDPVDSLGRTLSDLHPTPKGLEDHTEVPLLVALPKELGFTEELRQAREVAGLGREDCRVGEDVGQRHRVIEVRRQLDGRPCPLVGPPGIAGPQICEGESNQANSSRILGEQGQVPVPMARVVSVQGLPEVPAGSRQIALPERAHPEEVPTLRPGNRVVAVSHQESPTQGARVAEAAPLQSGQAQAA